MSTIPSPVVRERSRAPAIGLRKVGSDVACALGDSCRRDQRDHPSRR